MQSGQFTEDTVMSKSNIRASKYMRGEGREGEEVTEYVKIEGFMEATDSSQ